MSDYKRIKALRVPAEKLSLPSSVYDWCEEQSAKYPNQFDYCEVGKFGPAPCNQPCVDFVLETSYGEECGEWAKVRELYPAEKVKYNDLFHKYLPGVDMHDVRLVEFCWYNCCEAPDCYDPTEDEFYNEVPFILATK